MSDTHEKSEIRWEIHQYCNDIERDVVDDVHVKWHRFGREKVLELWEELPLKLAGPIGGPDAFMFDVPPGALLGERARTLRDAGLLGPVGALQPEDLDLQRKLKSRAKRLLEGDIANYSASLRSKASSLETASEMPAVDPSPGSDTHIDQIELRDKAMKELRPNSFRLFEMFLLGLKPKEIRAYFTEHQYKSSRQEVTRFMESFYGRAAAFGTAIFALLRRPVDKVAMFVSRTDPAIATGPAASGSGAGRGAAVVVAAAVALTAGGVAVTTGGEEGAKPKAVAAAPLAPNTLLPYGKLEPVKAEKKKPRKKKAKKKAVAPTPAAPPARYVPPASSASSGSPVDDGSLEYLPELRGTN